MNQTEILKLKSSIYKVKNAIKSTGTEQTI